VRQYGDGRISTNQSHGGALKINIAQLWRAESKVRIHSTVEAGCDTDVGIVPPGTQIGLGASVYIEIDRCEAPPIVIIETPVRAGIPPVPGHIESEEAEVISDRECSVFLPV